MSETQQTTTQEAPKVDIEAIKAAAIKEAEARAQQIAQEAIKNGSADIIKQTRDEIVKAIKGEPDEPPINPRVQQLLTDPDAVLSAYSDVISERVMNDVNRKTNERDVLQRTFAARADIAGSKIAQSAVAAIFSEVQQQNPESGFKQNLDEAIRKYDLEKEKESGSTKKEEVTPTGVSSSSTTQQTSTQTKSEDELQREELAAIKERQHAKRNGYSL